MSNLKKILMVDDDADLREALADQLVITEEFDVFEAGTGADGLAKALFVLGEEAFPVLRAFRARGLLFTPEGPVAGP